MNLVKGLYTCVLHMHYTYVYEFTYTYIYISMYVYICCLFLFVYLFICSSIYYVDTISTYIRGGALAALTHVA